MPSFDTPHPGRRLSNRTRLKPPLEARLELDGHSIQGWIVDQQDDGLGLRFGGADADRLLGAPTPWMSGQPTLALVGMKAPTERLPVRVVHVTASPAARKECLIGLTYDRVRMRPEHVLQLLETWQRFEPSAR
jgi:hypothetical protein